MLEEHATYLMKNGKKYYFLPFYFMDDETDEFEMFHLEHLPEELKEAIEFFRIKKPSEILNEILVKTRIDEK